MMKFFDALATDGGNVNVAELLAKEGVATEENKQVEIPAIDKNNTAPTQEPPKQEAQQNTETVEQKPPVEESKPVELPKAEPVIEQAKPVEVDWREVLKKQSEAEIMKAVGLDDKMINFLSRWKKGEDLKDYLEAATVNYADMAPEEIMRRDLQRQYGKLNAEDFEELYKMKVIEQYKLDPENNTEIEIRRGKLLLSVDADKIRQDFIKKQQELLFSKPPEPEPSTADIEAKAIAAEREKAISDYKGLVENNSVTKDLLSKRLLTIGEGDTAFNYEVAKPNEILDLLYSPDKWAEKLYNNEGVPNIPLQLLIGAIVNDHQAFFANYAKHHQSIGAKTLTEQLENASPPAGTPSKGDEGSFNPAAALAKGGVITSGY